MVNTILGLAIASFGIYHVVQAQLDSSIDTTPLWWLKMGGAILVGLGFAGYNVFTSFKLPQFSWPTLNSGKSETMAKDLPAEIKIKTEEESDIEALYYLTERCKETPEALECLRKLNDILFTKHHPVKAT